MKLKVRDKSKMTEIIFRTDLKSVSSSVFITELYLHIYHQPNSRDFILVNYFKHLFLQSLFILAWKNKQNQHYIKRTAHAHRCIQPLVHICSSTNSPTYSIHQQIWNELPNYYLCTLDCGNNTILVNLVTC